ncbi:MAG: glycoside hydrolase family 127 protein, partial [Deltaproteobacteria bacterium]
GKRTLLDVAIKNANLIDREFGWGKIEKYPGHQEIEIGLVKLYRVTDEKKYLDLAKFFLDIRGPGGWEYNQAHLKVIDQKEPVGHAVRAMYMFSGMADAAALTGDTAYLHAIDRIWENVVNKKMYITGGIGQTGGNEGFGPDYDLPNMSAYCETCASIAEVFLNQRLFLLHGDSKYIDIMERVIYNALLSGVALSGDLFFYDNPLESKGQHERQKWFGCACCPSNISRFLTSLTGYIYAHKGDDVYINLFTESETSFETPKGKFTLTQKSNYPWEGKSVIHVYPEYAGNRIIYIRVPGWARNEAVPGDLYRFEDRFDEPVEIRINGEEIKYEIEKGYALLDRKWQRGDSIEISLPMPVRKVIANEKVAENLNKFILQRGPLVYCAEGIDQEQNSVLHIFADKKQEFKTGINADFGGEITTIEFSATDVNRNLDGSLKADEQLRIIKAIPYCLWANRRSGEMITWIPFNMEAANPYPAPTIAFLSKKSSLGAKESHDLMSDQYEPKNSNDHSRGYIHWWPQKDTTVWVQYDFQKLETVSE